MNKVGVKFIKKFNTSIKKCRKFRFNSKISQVKTRRRLPRTNYYSKKMLRGLMGILTDNIKSYYYVIDQDTDKIIFNNKYVIDTFNEDFQGKKCYEAFWGKEVSCSNCPNKQKNKNTILYNEKLNKYIELNSSEICFPNKKKYYVINAVDITERKSYEYKIEKMKSIDILLDIPNRLELNRKVNELKKQDTKGMAVLINVEELRRFNENFGYEHGDSLLLGISQYLNQRQLKGMVYRYTGDKFALLLEDYDEEAARMCLEQAARRFDETWNIENREYKANIKVGIADLNLDIKNIESIYIYLDFAMKDKEIYSDLHKKIITFNGGEKDKIIRRFFIEDALKNGLKNDLFKVHYQPIYNLKNGGFTKAEALLRLKDRNGNYISPAEFIPIAEEKGFIVEMGYIVLDKVCKTVKEFQQNNIYIENINVNISVVQFMEKDFVEKVKKIIADNGIEPSTLEFEITESILISSFNSITTKMNELREVGINFSLDDFGTGYSSLMYLSQLPINSLKLDRIFVTQLEKRKNIEVLIEYVINLAKQLNLNVVVEGVETSMEDNIIRSFKGDYIQGFLYSKPLDEDSFKSFLISKKII